MLNAENGLIVVELIEALNNDDLNTTKQLVEILNTKIDIIGYIDYLIFSGSGNFSLENKSVNYLLCNALFLKDADLYIFRREVRRLMIKNNKENIRNFILQELQPNHKLKNSETFFSDLILLSNMLDEKEITDKIKNYMKEEVE